MFFLLFGGTMLCYGPDATLERAAIHRLENRVMVLAGVVYGPMELLMGTNLLHMVRTRLFQLAI